MSENADLQPVRPLTRREIREREQAAEQAARLAAAPSAASPPVEPVAQRQPVAPPSRRALRETAPAPALRDAPPRTVRPPAATGGVRGLDETGRLTPVQETSERTAVHPVTPSVNQPTRTSARPQVSTTGPLHESPQVPSRSSARPTPAGGYADTTRRRSAVPPPAQPTVQFAAFSAPAPAVPETSSAPDALWPGAPSPVEQQPVAVDSPSPWSTVPPSATAEPATTTPSPFPATHAGAPEVTTADELFPQPVARDVDDEPRGPSYTWLHYVILVAVAFVLGLLVWKLISQGDPAPAAESVRIQQINATGVAQSLELRPTPDM